MSNLCFYHCLLILTCCLIGQGISILGPTSHNICGGTRKGLVKVGTGSFPNLESQRLIASYDGRWVRYIPTP
uniref:Secreted protein n=1 Tax=Pristhesancus plagipennis TaxID=1955184 RepID=A0A2K8JMQ9_PRIPG|nr:secreted hypothetical protein [Pristhesancus plagipennis]